MIAFDLECSNGHLFEGWFQNIDSFEDQNKKKLISCPSCNDTTIRRVLSPVAMRNTTQADEEREMMSIDYPKLAKEIVNYINNNFEDVGTDFTKEALKMHYSVTEKRNIKGSATDEEEKLLEKEGITFFKVPIPKMDDDTNN